LRQAGNGGGGAFEINDQRPLVTETAPEIVAVSIPQREHVGAEFAIKQLGHFRELRELFAFERRFRDSHGHGVGSLQQRLGVGAGLLVINGAGRHVGEQHDVFGSTEAGEFVRRLPIDHAVVGAAVRFDFEAVLEKGDHAERVVSGELPKGGFAFGDDFEHRFQVPGVAESISPGQPVTQAVSHFC